MCIREGCSCKKGNKANVEGPKLKEACDHLQLDFLAAIHDKEEGELCALPGEVQTNLLDLT